MTAILLVEDDPFKASVHMSALQNRFPEVCRVHNAAEAFCLIENRSFSDNLGLVITGSHLPDLAGPDFVAELQARIPGLQVIVLGELQQDEAGSYQGENLLYLAKPAPVQELVSAAQQMIAQDGHKVA